MLANTVPSVALTYAELCRLAGYPVPTTSGVLGLLAGRAGPHIDLKEPDCLGVIVTQALSVLTPERIIVSTGNRIAVAELAAAGRRAGRPTIGGDLADTARYLAGRARLPAQSPVDAVVAAGAAWAVVHERLARAGALADCRRRGLATMVWTVNATPRWRAGSAARTSTSSSPTGRAAPRRCGAQSPQSSN